MDADLSRAVWHKSSFSNGNGGNCVEVARNLPGIVALRDSKDPEGPKLVITQHDWVRLVWTVKAGRFDR